MYEFVIDLETRRAIMAQLQVLDVWVQATYATRFSRHSASLVWPDLSNHIPELLPFHQTSIRPHLLTLSDSILRSTT